MTRTAVVTGAARGIGFGIAEVLAREGQHVILADRDGDAATAAAARLADRGGKATALGVDVASRAAVAAFADDVLKLTGRVDVLCSNAAVFGSAPLERMDEAEWDRLLSVNLKGAFLMTQAFLPAMRQAGYGRIVITSSITGTRTAIPAMAHYAASKAGLSGFVRAAAMETAGSGITVNAVEPGHVMTEGAAALYDEAFLAATRAHIPMGRLAEPAEIGEAVAFLASERAGYITGQTLIVDGGVTLREYPAGFPRV